ncbi:MAG: hypothetical protein AUI14_23200 [Actinobacteria bacterium 13_2_20CM_2_71_6]|nr:MAG: hypothetical protein AUI14_23200 [Actinobacteria bacterium 13_2_20CM_2_71_6]
MVRPAPHLLVQRGCVGWATAHEQGLWELVEEAEQIRASAPPALARTDLLAARDALARALTLRERVARQVALVEEALRRPGSWLRPLHRGRLVGQLRARRVALEAAGAPVERAERRFAQLRRQAAVRRDYLATHREALSAGRAARSELDRHIDELIDGYARMPHPPAWFRFGLGYPPGPGEHADWLRRAREEIAARRRYGAGGGPPPDPVTE